jgi:hypothetical protein
VVAQVGMRRPLLAKKLEAYGVGNPPQPACGMPEWQRDPMRITFHPAGKGPLVFDFAPGSAVLVEDGGEADVPEGPAKP